MNKIERYLHFVEGGKLSKKTLLETVAGLRKMGVDEERIQKAIRKGQENAIKRLNKLTRDMGIEI